MIPTTADIGACPAGILSVRVHHCEDDPPRARDPAAKKPPQQRKQRKPRDLSWGKVAEIRSWYAANPGEYLSFADMVRRFDITTKRAYAIVSVLRSEGLIRSEVLTYLNPERPRV